MVLAAIEPGRAGIVGAYGGRAWVALAKFDTPTGKAKVKVIHEAREDTQNVDDEQARSTTIGFQPRYIAALAAPANPNGAIERRLLVGRGTVSSAISNHPLLIDPNRETVALVEDEFPSLFSPFHRLNIVSTDDAVFFVEPRAGQVYRFGSSDLSKKPVGKRLPAGTPAAVAIHDGRFYFVREIVDNEPPGELRPPWGFGNALKRNYELWALGSQRDKRAHRVAANLPQLISLAVSSHYGLVCFTSVPTVYNGPSGQYFPFRTIEFVNPPKK